MVNALTAIGLAIVSLIGFLWMLVFNTRLNEKADKTQVTTSIENALERYHRLFVKEFKEDIIRMHGDNEKRLQRIEDKVTK